MNYEESFIRIARASVYFEGERGLIIEFVEWDRSDCVSSERRNLGDFQINASKYSRGFPAFFNVKNAMKWVRSEFGVDPHVRLN